MSGRRTNNSRTPALLWAAAVGLAAVGCAAPSGLLATSWPIDPGDAVRLEPNEGLLVVHVRSNRPLQSIDVGGVLAAEDLPEGTAVRLIGISSGTYRWAQIKVEGETFLFSDHSRLRFHVQPGVINYVGMIDVEREGLSLRLNSLDRTAMGLEQLRKQFPDLAEKYRTVYSGTARHVFLDRHRGATAGGDPESARRDGREGRISAAAQALFREPALLRVALNPSGTLSFTQGYNAGTQVVSVRNTANGASTTVFSHGGPILVDWEDDDTLIVQTGEGTGRFAIDLELHEFGVVSRQHQIKARGWLIDPLPLVPGVVLWADWDGETSSVMRAPLGDLENLAFVSAEHRIVALPERVLLWVPDSHGVPRAAVTLASEAPIWIALRYRDGAKGRWKQLGEWGVTDQFPIPVGVARDGRDLLVVSSEGSETAALCRFSVSERKVGDRDRVVDPEHAYRMRAMLDANGKPYEWMLLEDATHDPNPKQWVQLMSRVFEFLAQHLQTGSGSGK